VTRAAHAERERLFAEVRRVETLLRAALGMVEETSRDLPAGVTGLRPVAEALRTRGSSRPSACPRRPRGAKLPPVQSCRTTQMTVPREARDFAWG